MFSKVDQVFQDLQELFRGLQQEVKHSVDDDVFLRRSTKRQQQQLRRLVRRQEGKSLQLQGDNR